VSLASPRAARGIEAVLGTVSHWVGRALSLLVLSLVFVLLFVPIGDGPTIGAEQAAAIATRLSARVVVPMHYRTERIDFLEPVDAFAQGAARVHRHPSPAFELEALETDDGPLVVVPPRPEPCGPWRTARQVRD
jgi:hypothetical protein